MLTVGDDAPDFELLDQDGRPTRLTDFAGPVVVYFYPRADTPGCTSEACGFRDAWEEYEDRDITVLGISDDSPADLRAFAEKYDLPFTLLSDPDGEVAARYDSYGEKHMFGKRFDGTFRNTYLVDDGEVTGVYEDVTPEGHAEELLDDLDARGESTA
ncbi:thioredoxin-dependent thiol peroxidase [Halomarina ordinaria]|uniref:thioredoxin-dependent peroxiredoxin n=1 Tax=Halomarina ordinaria TaxID=3033939 RepID=A0ABD5UDP9_9EURY|nr:thioredoxin-dependent thiol peroxidase [Halomarina sp. PSRA2]